MLPGCAVHDRCATPLNLFVLVLVQMAKISITDLVELYGTIVGRIIKALEEVYQQKASWKQIMRVLHGTGVDVEVVIDAMMFRNTFQQLHLECTRFEEALQELGPGDQATVSVSCVSWHSALGTECDAGRQTK